MFCGRKCQSQCVDQTQLAIRAYENWVGNIALLIHLIDLIQHPFIRGSGFIRNEGEFNVKARVQGGDSGDDTKRHEISICLVRGINDEHLSVHLRHSLR